MKVAQVPKPKADFEVVEREVPERGRGQVRIKVKAVSVSVLAGTAAMTTRADPAGAGISAIAGI